MIRNSLMLLLIGALCMMSCDNELDLIAPQKDIPIVYGLLTPFDSVQYIRIERAFVDPVTSAFEIAQRPDSLYYPALDVRIASGDQEFSFTRVDGNLEGIQRDSGAFATSPNYLYKANTADLNLQQGEIYELRINRGDNLPLVTASALLINPARISKPSASSRIDFDLVDETKITWRVEDAGQIYDVRLFFNYLERNADPDIPDVVKRLEWLAGKNLTEPILAVNGRLFYNHLAQEIPVDVNVTRAFRNVDVEVTSGGEEIFEYIKVGQANLGITSSQEVPTYSNLSEGFGIFSSRSKAEVMGVQLSSPTLDELKNGSITKDLNFR